MATWRSGDAADCKSVHPGSIPGVASNPPKNLSNINVSSPVGHQPNQKGGTLCSPSDHEGHAVGGHFLAFGGACVAIRLLGG